MTDLDLDWTKEFRERLDAIKTGGDDTSVSDARDLLMMVSANVIQMLIERHGGRTEERCVDVNIAMIQVASVSPSLARLPLDELMRYLLEAARPHVLVGQVSHTVVPIGKGSRGVDS